MSYITDYHYQWTAALTLGVLSLLFHFALPKFGKLPTTYLAFLIFSVLWVWSFRDNRYVSVDPYNQTAIRYFSADSLLKGLLVVFPFAYLSHDRVLFYVLGRLIFAGFAIVNSLVVVAQFLFQGCAASNSCGGLVGNPSISLGLTVCMLPLIACWQVWVIVGAAVIISKSSIAAGLLAVFLILKGVPCLREKSAC